MILKSICFKALARRYYACQLGIMFNEFTIVNLDLSFYIGHKLFIKLMN